MLLSCAGFDSTLVGCKVAMFYIQAVVLLLVAMEEVPAAPQLDIETGIDILGQIAGILHSKKDHAVKAGGSIFKFPEDEISADTEGGDDDEEEAALSKDSDDDYEEEEEEEETYYDNGDDDDHSTDISEDGVNGGRKKRPGNGSLAPVKRGNDDCGIKLDSRIVGGIDSKKNEWRWLVALGEPLEDGSFQATCGGTLIGWDTVLTAAHCFMNVYKPGYVRVGDTNIESSEDGTGTDLKIKQHPILHPDWNPDNLDNDICILKLVKPATPSKSVSLACLPYSFRGSDLTHLPPPFIVGWGATESGGYVTPQLQQAQVPVVSQDICQRKYSAETGSTIDETKLCAGNGVQDTCQGDSGGPMLASFSRPSGIPNLETEAWAIIGVTSFGIDCASSVPGVYTRVTEYLDWIEEWL